MLRLNQIALYLRGVVRTDRNPYDDPQQGHGAQLEYQVQIDGNRKGRHERNPRRFEHEYLSETKRKKNKKITNNTTKNGLVYTR